MEAHYKREVESGLLCYSVPKPPRKCRGTAVNIGHNPRESSFTSQKTILLGVDIAIIIF